MCAMERTKRNIVVIGDSLTGKTCLLHTYTNKGTFLNSYIPTLYDSKTMKLELDGKHYSINLQDTAGQEEFDQIRKFTYSDADAFILCYSCTEQNSFDNIKLKWAPELKSACPNVPIILVATKIDLRKELPAQATSTATGEAMRKKIKAVKFMECSAKEYQNVKEVFEEAIRATGPPQKSDKEFCGFCDFFARCFARLKR